MSRIFVIMLGFAFLAISTQFMSTNALPNEENAHVQHQTRFNRAGCTKPCVATTEYSPVCGTDGKTYSNKGALDCEKQCQSNLKVAYQGKCKGTK